MTKTDIPPVGAKVELTMDDIFGFPYLRVGKIAKEPYQHGYYCKSGAWGLYPLNGDEPCYKFWFIPKSKRKYMVLEIKNIVSIREVRSDD